MYLGCTNNYHIYNYNHSEPILVMDKGLMVELIIFNRIIFQSYFIHADMKDPDEKKISWAHDTGEHDQSIKSFYAWGFFLNYFDDYLDIFIEFGLPFKETKSGQSRDIVSERYGTVYNFSYNNNFFFNLNNWKKLR